MRNQGYHLMVIRMFSSGMRCLINMVHELREGIIFRSLYSRISVFLPRNMFLEAHPIYKSAEKPDKYLCKQVSRLSTSGIERTKPILALSCIFHLENKLDI